MGVRRVVRSRVGVVGVKGWDSSGQGVVEVKGVGGGCWWGQGVLWWG